MLNSSSLKIYSTKIIDALPDYNYFLPIEELDASSHALVAKYPNLATIKIVGYSRDNHPIKMLRIGNGNHRALFVGCPHPNEPIGIMSLEYLSQILCSDQNLTEQLDYTFYIIKVIDVDGYRLNQGWLKEPYTPDRYIKGYFRPSLEEQPEWTFPYEYKTFKFRSPSPETKAFMCAIDEARPHFLNSLHNASETGTFFYLSEVIPEEINKKLRSLVQKYNLPIMRGEPEAPFMRPLSDGFYLLPRLSQVYDFYESILPQGTDPSCMIQTGACSADYALKYGTFTLVSEITLFSDPRMDDTTPTNQIRRDIIQTNIEEIKQHFSFFHECYRSALTHINQKTRFQSAVDSNIKIFEQIFLHQEQFAKTTEQNYLRCATVAELFDNETRYQWILLNTVSMFVRMTEAQQANPELQKIQTKIKTWFDDYLVNLLNKLNYKVQSLRDLSAIQLESALMVMEHIKNRTSSNALCGI